MRRQSKSVSAAERLKAVAVAPKMLGRVSLNIAVCVKSSFETIRFGAIGSQRVMGVDMAAIAVVFWESRRPVRLKIQKSSMEKPSQHVNSQSAKTAEKRH